jgi:hypothetical protein
MQNTSTSQTGGEVSARNLVRRTAASMTALVTTPATEESHQRTMRTFQQGSCREAVNKEATRKKAIRKEAVKEERKA